jgi:hypothetical protein
MSPSANGSRKATLAELISGVSTSSASRSDRRFFGTGDYLRNAELEFGDGAQVEVQSRFEHCNIRLGKDAELVVGADGRLVDCTVTGGRVHIIGTFLERRSPALIGTSELLVSSVGALAATVQQPAESTRFAFERGCRLRVRIMPPSTEHEHTGES